MNISSKPNAGQEGRYDYKQWILPIDAVHLLAPVCGGDEQAKAILLSRVSEGKLDAWADWLLEEADIDEIAFEEIEWSNEIVLKCNVDGRSVRAYFVRQAPGYGALPLKRDFLSVEDGWTIAEDLLNWGSGVFIGRKLAKQSSFRKLPNIPGLMSRKVISGLEFRRTDIEEIAGVGFSSGGFKGNFSSRERGHSLRDWSAELPIDEPPSKADELSSTGNKRSDAWYDWVAEVVVYVDLHGIDTDMPARKFHNEIGDLLKARGQVSPSRDSTEKAISAIKNRLREHKNSEKSKFPG